MRLFFISIFSVFFSLGCVKKETKIQWTDPDKLHQGPIVHQRLSEEQKQRIFRLQKTFSEVDSTPIEKWMDDFMRDQNPDREIQIWNNMAQAYRTFTQTHKLSLAGKKEVFQIVLLRSSAPEKEVLQRLNLKVLTQSDAREVLSNYQDTPKPIQVYKK